MKEYKDFYVKILLKDITGNFLSQTDKIRFNKAIAHFNLENNDKAIEILELLSQEKNNPRFLLNLGYLLYKVGKYDKALQIFTQVIEIDPFFIEAYLNAFKTCIVLENYAEARKYCDAALRLEPQNPKVNKAKALYYFKLGNVSEYLKIIGKIKEKDIFQNSSDNNIQRLKENASVLVGECRVSVMIAVFSNVGIRKILLGYRDGKNNFPSPTMEYNWIPLHKIARDVIVKPVEVDDDIAMKGYSVEGLEHSPIEKEEALGFFIVNFKFEKINNLEEDNYVGLLLVDHDKKIRIEPKQIFFRELCDIAKGDLVDLYQDMLIACQNSVYEGEKKEVKETNITIKRDVKNLYAVCIGINTYKDDDISNLKWAKNDASKFAKLLKNNFSESSDNIKLVLDEDATGIEIRELLEGYLKNNSKDDDIVIIFYSGHGSPELTGMDKIARYLVPHDAVYDKIVGSCLSLENFDRMLEKISAKQIIVFMDCCFSGRTGGKTFKGSNAKDAVIPDTNLLEEISGEGRIIVCAAKDTEIAFEHANLQHGIFTYNLIQGLCGNGVKQKDGKIKLTDVLSFIEDSVPEKCKELNTRKLQTPNYKGYNEHIMLPVLKKYDSQRNKNSKVVTNNTLPSYVPKLKKEFTDKEKKHFMKASLERIADLINHFGNETQQHYPEVSCEVEKINVRKILVTLYKSGKLVISYKIWFGGTWGPSKLCFLSGRNLSIESDNQMNGSLSIKEQDNTLKFKVDVDMRSEFRDVALSVDEVADYFWKLACERL